MVEVQRIELAPAPAARLRPRMQALRQALFGRSRLGLVALLVAAAFLLPLLGLLSSLAQLEAGKWQELWQGILPRMIVNTLAIALGVGIGTGLLGTLTAWLVTMCRFPGQRLLEWALVLPLAVPAYVMAYCYTDFLAFGGPLQSTLRDLFGWAGPRDYWFPTIQSLGGAILVLSFVLYPYVYLLARSAFMEQSICALEVSRTLGCSAWGAFRRVALPTARPAIVAGIALAVMEAMADFGAVSYFGIQTFTTGIYRAWISYGDRILAAQLSVLLLGFVFLVLALERWSRQQARYHHTSARYRALRPVRLGPLAGGLALLACLLPVILGFLLPLAVLGRMILRHQDAVFDARYFGLISNSLTLAAVAGALALLVALLLAYGQRTGAGRIGALANRLAGLGYAAPGTVVAVAVLLPLAALDNGIAGWLERSFGVKSGLLLTGSIVALVYAYLVRFLAVSLGTVEASLGKIRPTLDDAARSLGAGPLRRLGRVHAPIMSGSLMTAFLIVFVEVVKELPATLVMRPFNFDTLAVKAHQFASDERLAQAALPALTIVAIAVLPLILLTRSIARSRPGSKS